MAVETKYVDLELFKAWRTAKPSGTDRDDLMNLAISAASRAIDSYTGRRFYLDEDATARTFNARDNVSVDGDGGRLFIADIGAEAGLLVEQGSALTSWTDLTAGLELYPANALALGKPVTGLLSPAGWTPGSATRVRVTARWGWPLVPDDVKQACLILAAKRYERRNSANGTLGVADWGTIRVSRADPDVKDLLDPFRILVVA